MIQNLTEAYNEALARGDPRVETWLLMKSPVPSAVILLVYLVVVATRHRIMVNVRPLQLKWLIIPYNFSLVGLSAYIFYELHLPASGLFYVTSCYEDGKSVLVVLLFQGHRTVRHSVFYCPEEVGESHISACLSPFLHDHQLVAWCQVCSWRPVIFCGHAKQLCAHNHVFLLRTSSHWPTHAEVPVVETLPHTVTTGAVFGISCSYKYQPVHHL